MGTLLFLLVALAVIVVLLVLKYIGYRKDVASGEESAPSETVHGMILSLHTSPLGTMSGKKMLSAEVLLDGGEKQTLHLHSYPLFQSLSSGDRGALTVCGKTLVSFQKDMPSST